MFFAVAISSIQEGTWNHMVDSVVHYHFGYAQIHKDGYWNDKSIDNAFDAEPAFSSLANLENVTQLVPRIESFAWHHPVHLPKARWSSESILLKRVN
ncbi:MAG: hypothetical protein IPL46_07300 [Saprospiraceae bacterium]|nr:hypothetical protein [Saprospiraceae bacterium]